MMNDEQTLSKFEQQIRDCFGRVTYSHKTHEKMADRYAVNLTRYKFLQIAMTALISSGAITVVFLDDTRLKIATAVVSFFTLFISAYFKNFDPGGNAQKHRDTAAKLWGIRERYFSLLTDLQTLSLDKAQEQRDEILERLEAVYTSAPQTDAKAYSQAKSALKYNEELSFTTEEIDCFLPPAHKKSKDV